MSDTKIITRVIEDEMKESYLAYSMSVIVGRALPDVRDGLKPVHRRILFSMFDMGMLHNKPFKKCARIVGEVLGKYHPHGDTAVYDSLVRMGQPFSLRYPLIQGQGNFGSVDGDSAAAMRYCITGDSLVVTQKGLMRIGKLSDQEDININILSKEKKVNKASKWFDSGEHPTLKITTNKGYSLTGSSNHPVLVLTRDDLGKPLFMWKLLEQIEEGDILVIDRSVDTFWPEQLLDVIKYYPQVKNTWKKRILPKFLDKDLAFILGSFIAEGTVTDTKIEFCNTDKKWISQMQKRWEKLFPNSKLHLFKMKPSPYGKKDYYRLECHCRHTVAFLNNIGLDPVKSAYRKIPELILQSPKDIVVSFLQTYFEGDGSISYAPKMIELSCCSKSEQLIDELQILLLRLGLDGTKRFDKHKNIWKLYLRGYRNVLRFYKEIGFLSDYKTKKLEYVVYNYKKDRSLTDYVPYVSDYIRNETDSAYINKNNFDRYSTMENRYSQVSSILLRETEINHSSMLEYFLQYQYLFDPVVSIQDAGIQKVFSIKVESDCHSFISNGIISHNTEARLNKLSEELLQDIDKETVTWAPNFDGSLNEPTVLPAKAPNLLINGSTGIAVGMATNIPPHNLTEITTAAIALIENPEITMPALMSIVPGPDFPTGGVIVGNRGIKNAYATGRGKIKVKARAEIEGEKKKSIIITEIPYQVNKSVLIEDIANLIRDKKVTGVSNLRDESDREGMRIVLDLKTSAMPDVVLTQLYKYSRLQVTYGIINLVLVNNEPKILSLKALLSEFIKYRQDIVRKRTAYDLKKAEEKAHILEGLIIALDDIDTAIELIKKAKSVSQAREQLMDVYSITEIQAKAILEMRLQKLTSLEQEKIREEHDGLLRLIKELQDILASEQRILDIIKKELEEIKDKYGDVRKTNILALEAKAVEEEELIKPEQMIVTITNKGYVKRLQTDTYKKQHRGGKGMIATTTKQEDVVEDLFIANTRDSLLAFTNLGKVHWLKVYSIPEAERYARGQAIVNLIELEKGEKVTTVIPVSDFNHNQLIVLVTKFGIVKKIRLETLEKPRKGGIKAIGIISPDELVSAMITDGTKDIMIATAKGQAIKFSERNIREMGRTAYGVTGIKLDSDVVIGAVISDNNKSLLTITEKGYGKRTKMDEYRLIGRGGKGVINLKITEKNGRVVAIKSVDVTDELMIITKKGIAIRMGVKGISEIGRNTQGLRLINLSDEDEVVSAAKIVEE